jgi:8-oxo-dGTP diphosphatase
LVVVICILKKREQFLICSRPKGKEFAGWYEFPGGKVEKNEYLVESLKRELLEELSIKLNTKNMIFLQSYEIKRQNKKILLNFFITNKWSGRIKNLENQRIKWVDLKKIRESKILKSNKKIINTLSLFFPTTR